VDLSSPHRERAPAMHCVVGQHVSSFVVNCHVMVCGPFATFIDVVLYTYCPETAVFEVDCERAVLTRGSPLNVRTVVGVPGPV